MVYLLAYQDLNTLFHNHHYPEVHIVRGGAVRFEFADRTLELYDGEALVIPGGVAHVCHLVGEGAKRTAFQIDLPITDFRRVKISTSLVDELVFVTDRPVSEINLCKVVGCVQMLCSDIFSEYSETVKRTADPPFVIHEFIATNYACDARLSDLAASLHLSEKQTARLVEKCTGKTFKQAMLEQRMNMAEYLIDKSSKTFAEIAEHLGYQSYAGFYKAYTKYFGEKANVINPPHDDEK